MFVLVWGPLKIPLCVIFGLSLISINFWIALLFNVTLDFTMSTSLSFQPQFKISPEFPHGLLFHLQPKLPGGFPPPTITIPGGSPRNPRDFAHSLQTFTQFPVHTENRC